MRCGSTTVDLLLSQHPEIFMSPAKEPYFFLAERLRERLAEGTIEEKEVRQFEARGRYRTWETFSTLFADASSEKWIGESSHYLYSPDVAHLIFRLSPGSRILASFRDPTERMLSEYARGLRQGTINEPISDFVLRDTHMENGKIISFGKESKLGRGLQAQRITPWLSTFGPEQVKWIFFEDICNRPLETAQEVYSWLNVDANFRPRLVHTQSGGAIPDGILLRAVRGRHPLVRVLKSAIPRLLKQRILGTYYKHATKRPRIPLRLEKELRRFYSADVRNLERFTGRDLRHWTTDAP
jgi:hypothetical protein